MNITSFAKLLIVAAPLILLTGDAHAQSSSLSCPPNYALSIDPTSPPADDQNSPDANKPQTAADKLQAEQQAKANEMARWHCVPLDSIRSQQPQQN